MAALLLIINKIFNFRYTYICPDTHIHSDVHFSFSPFLPLPFFFPCSIPPTVLSSLFVTPCV